jgi:hypothetical protein
MSEDAGATSTQGQPAPESGPKPVSWAPVPKVNLLPLEVVENRAFRRTQLVLVGAVVLAAGAVGVGTVWAQRGVGDAQAEADAAQGRVAQLQTEKVKYTPIPGIIAQVDAAEAARQSIYSSDVRWYRYMNTLARNSAQAGVELSSVTITVTASATSGTAASGGDVLTPGGIGTITFNGTGAEYRQVSAWLEAVDKTTGLQGRRGQPAGGHLRQHRGPGLGRALQAVPAQERN